MKYYGHENIHVNLPFHIHVGEKGKHEVVKLGNEVIVFGIVQGGPYNKV
jgi:hypothetical protein